MISFIFTFHMKILIHSLNLSFNPILLLHMFFAPNFVANWDFVVNLFANVTLNLHSSLKYRIMWSIRVQNTNAPVFAVKKCSKLEENVFSFKLYREWNTVRSVNELWIYIYLTTKETWHLVFVNNLVLNEITVHSCSLCLNLNYRSLRCNDNF